MIWPKKRGPVDGAIEQLAAGPSDEVRAKIVAFGDEAVDVVVKAIKSGAKSHRHRAELVRAVGEFGPAAARAIPTLIRALDDISEDVGDEAGEALYLVGKESIPPLVDAMRHEARDSGVIAIGVLARFRQHAVPALVEALGSRKAIVRMRAAETLGEIGDPARDARDSLEVLLEDKVPEVAREALRALRRIR